MTVLIEISDSLRRGSFNSAVLRAAAELLPSDVQLKIDTIADIPLYDGDAEAENGIPPAVSRLKNAICDADGLLLVTPEYNSSVSGVAKNAIDWSSRPPANIPRVFGNRVVAIAGRLRHHIVSERMLPVFTTLGAQLWSDGRLLVSRASHVVDADGRITDAATRDAIRKIMGGFVRFVQDSKAH